MAASIIAAALTFAVPIATAPQAQALVVAPPPIPPVLFGGAASAGGAAVSAGAACVASVVCLGAVGVAAAAVGLYATRDSWVPALRRYFGPDVAESVPTVSASQPVDTFVVLTGPAVINDGRGLAWSVVNNAPGYGSRNVAYWAEYACSSGGALSWGTSKRMVNTPNGGARADEVNCAVGSTIIAVLTRAATTAEWAGCVTGCYSVPASLLRWGSAAFPDDSQNVYRATSKCVLADGSTQDVVVEYQGQAGADIGFLIPSCLEAGVGTHARSVDVDVRLPGRTDFRDVWDVEPPADPLYPDCDPASPNVCVLEVWVDGSACQVGDARCLDWATAVQSRLQCKWGPYTVPLATCDMLERAYRPGGATIAEPDIDGNPATGTNTNPDPAPSGGPFPTEVPVPPGEPVPDDVVQVPGGSGCWPTGTARWNPLEWVLRPVQCALAWAFIPDGGLDVYTDRFGAAWGSSDVGTWVSEVGGSASTLGAGVGGVGGCGGPQWTITLGGRDYPFRPLDACNEPMSTIAPFVKAAVAAVVVLAGVRAVMRPITRSLDLPSVPGRSG